MRTRHLQIIGLRPERREEYLRLHREVWPEVEARLKASNFESYSIFNLGDTLYGYFEHVGTDYAADMAAMGDDPKTREWWKLTDPCQEPLPEAAAAGAMWTDAKEVYHLP
ncbi:L-rhamnose mutarotase [Arthrobacter stackebrandtii]|uniref:L-rhamnose mutarotase n=1 Tax=Arthrobacter stackebrandtii TaxID=272161 RepID=A0ABS4YSL4_9MICC|nr:L-rhamnose mutarotase [Arthrobacter stackebrandtii]MBP2411791.1 L-rhamnose mutarotase [Arthrobacter stackebrandtii]PYG99183.1 L-rhamnose mutarotase [Arthrobacter stackebrandtii]